MTPVEIEQAVCERALQNTADHTTCAENILLARGTHFPATIADLHDSDPTLENLRAAHARNDGVLERLSIGCRVRNDTERLEKPLELDTKTPAAETSSAPAGTIARRSAVRIRA